MNAYYIAEGEQVAGPFAEEQLVNMWRNGSVTANAQVCLEGSGEWVSIRTELNAIEASAEAVPMEKRKPTAEAMMMQQMLRASQAKSAGIAVLISIFIPGGGHMYAGEVGAGIIALFLTAFLLFFGGFLALLVWIVCIIDAGNAVKRYNAKL